jgi:C-terminal processing protease CtpA/Prc
VARGENIGNSQTVPIVVLISPDSVSAAEIFAGALQGKGRARLVGQPSAGNIEGLRTYIFEDGSILFIAEQRFTLTNGFNWEGQGLQPIITAGGKWDDISVDNDPALIAATNLLLGK